ncbi:hypothetical protein HK101_003471 [Irineochytrium annulatum]|nr:hypothetical protein HK101_003471 [Irineochytrium annulatum]
MNQHDIFIFLQNVPALITAVAFTLQKHPYLRKRTRRSHETFIIASLTVLMLVTVGTSVSPYMNAQVAQYSLGALEGVATLAQAGANLWNTWTLVMSDDRPPAMQFLIAGVGILFGAAWAAYGFYGAQDYFISIPFLVLAVHSIIHLLLLGYAAYRSGGLETGWDSQSEAEDDDMTVDRLNRANTRSSYAGSVRSMPRSYGGPGNRNSHYGGGAHQQGQDVNGAEMQQAEPPAAYVSDEEVGK